MAHHPRARRFGGFMTLVLILLVIFVGVGFWRGWFSLSTRATEDGDGQTDVTLSIDQEEMERDAEAALEATRREAREVGEKIRAATDIRSVEGAVESVDPQQRTVTVRTEDNDVQTFRADENTELSRDDEPAEFGGISAGDTVIVVYREGEQRRVDSITIVEGERGERPDVNNE